MWNQFMPRDDETLRCVSTLFRQSVEKAGARHGLGVALVSTESTASTKVMVARGVDTRGNNWEFAAKAGNNHEHHNHNDCGSFILHVNGAPVVMDIGAPEYVRDYFNENRYMFLAARSAGHSVPIVNGFEQSAGAEFDAEVLECEIKEDTVTFVMDLAKCYPKEARCRQLIRSLILDKREGSLTVTDTAQFEGDGVLESSIISEAPITVGDDGVWFLTSDGRRVRLTPAAGAVVSGLEHVEYRNRLSEPALINRLRIRPEKAFSSVSVKFTFDLPSGPTAGDSFQFTGP